MRFAELSVRVLTWFLSERSVEADEFMLEPDKFVEETIEVIDTFF